MFLYDVDYLVCVIGFQSVYVNNRELFASRHTFEFHSPLNTAWFRYSPPWLGLHVRWYSRVTNYQYQHVYLTVSVLGGDGDGGRQSESLLQWLSEYLSSSLSSSSSLYCSTENGLTLCLLLDWNYIFITFCVSRRRRKMYYGHARLCVSLSVCPRP